MKVSSRSALSARPTRAARTPFWRRSEGRRGPPGGRHQRRNRDRYSVDDRPAPRGGDRLRQHSALRTCRSATDTAKRFGVPARDRERRKRRGGRRASLGRPRLRHMVMLTLGTGVGGGLILDLAISTAARSAPRPSSATSHSTSGPPCQGRCPGRGHLGALASGTPQTAMRGRRAESRREIRVRGCRGQTVDARLAVRLAAHGPAMPARCSLTLASTSAWALRAS
jgi:hypothetical protein